MPYVKVSTVLPVGHRTKKKTKRKTDNRRGGNDHERSKNKTKITEKELETNQNRTLVLRCD